MHASVWLQYIPENGRYIDTDMLAMGGSDERTNIDAGLLFPGLLALVITDGEGAA